MNGPSVLYTSLAREGALAELSFHLGQLEPGPSKPIQIAHLRAEAGRTLRLVRADPTALAIDEELAEAPNYARTQMVGDAVEWLGLDGLIVPSARWSCENLFLFTGNRRPDLALEMLSVEDVAWQTWALEHGLIEQGRWPPSDRGRRLQRVHLFLDQATLISATG